jgi:hypothetical protein
MKTSRIPRFAGTSALLCLLVSLPAAAVILSSENPAAGGRPVAASSPGVGKAGAPGQTVDREGFVQAFDAAGKSIVINSTRYVIGAPQLALLDKRPKNDGTLTLAGLKVGMYVRYRTAADNGAQRVVELWVVRDPQQVIGAKP